MAQVFILSEDDFDDHVYACILGSLLQRDVERLPGFRGRRGGGVGAVKKSLRHLVDHIRFTGVVDDTFFVVALDNDRKPTHARHSDTAPRFSDCRHCEIEDAIAAGMPGRPIAGAVAVPVEMIEAWLLLMFDPLRFPHESALPRFGRSDQSIARQHLGPRPPPQLKDLVDDACRASNTTKADFACACVRRLDPDDLARRSPSFASFRAQVATWKLSP